MFVAADPLVKAVILSLILASLITWTVFLAKSVQLALAGRRLRKRLRRIAAVATLTEAQSAAGGGKNILSTLISAVVDEVRVSARTQAGGVQARAASRLADVVRSEGRVARTGMGLLATIGSTAPFVGLFGTVWGILGALTAIGIAGQASIDKVAGPVGEALIMTALGLFVAVPAVLCYNFLVRRNKVLNEKFRSFANDLQTYLLSSKR
jgi:biopolymer transport protein ExbB